MTVKDTSIVSHKKRVKSGINETQRQKILDFCRKHKMVTRKMIAQHLGIETATISGQVKPLLNAGDLTETLEKFPCPVTGNTVHWLQRFS